MHLSRCIASSFRLVVKVWESGVLGMRLCASSSGVGGTVLLRFHSEVVLWQLAYNMQIKASKKNRF